MKMKSIITLVQLMMKYKLQKKYGRVAKKNFDSYNKKLKKKTN